MKIRNRSERNITVHARYTENKGVPFSLLLIATAILEISADEYLLVKEPIKELVKAGVVSIEEAPETTLTEKEIIDLVQKKANVTLSEKDNKATLQSKAEALGVEIS